MKGYFGHTQEHRINARKGKRRIIPKVKMYYRVVDFNHRQSGVAPHIPYMPIEEAKAYLISAYGQMLVDRHNPKVVLELVKESGRTLRDRWNADILRANLRKDELKGVRLKEWDYKDFKIVRTYVVEMPSSIKESKWHN